MLITLDTTRVDALGVYGCTLPTTPNLDALAAEGRTFDWCRSVGPMTLPSHASMMTGLYPPRHGLRANGLGALPRSAHTLAEAARAAGIETAAFVAAVVLDRRFGLAQGFDVYDEPSRAEWETTNVLTQRPGREVVDAAIGWVRGRDASQRFFLWVHLFEPHDPYVPAPRFLQLARGNPYLGEVAAMDHEVGRLLAALRETGTWEDTAVLAVGDHGEDLYDHGEPNHACYGYDTTLRVPLILRHPRGQRAGERSAEVVSVVDVGPTLREALGLSAAEGADGLSLWSGPVPGDRGVYFETYHGYLNYGWSPLAGWADARMKYIHSPAPELYAPGRDPLERHNLLDGQREDAGVLRDAMAAVASRPVLLPDGDAPVDASLVEGLAELGYAVAGSPETALPPPLETTQRPAPSERLGELQEFLRAMSLNDERQLEEAVRILEGIVRENPAHVAALDQLGSCLGRLERWPEAVGALERCVVLDERRPAVHINLAVGYEATGQLELALLHARRGVEIDPQNQLGRVNLARILEQLGRTDEAERVRAGSAR